MSGSVVFKEKKGASYDPTAKADLSPDTDSSDEAFKPSGSDKNAAAKKGSKVKKETKEPKKNSTKEAKKKSKR